MAVCMIHCEPIDGKLSYCKFAGKTADTKPTGDWIATGSEYFDIQKAKTYYYDSAGSSGSEWVTPSSS